MARRRGPMLLSLAAIPSCFNVTPVASEPSPSATPLGEPTAELDRVHEHADADGPGWRLRDDVFESVHEPVRVEPLPGWRLVPEGGLDPVRVTSGFGLVHDRHQIELYFRRPPIVLHELHDQQFAEWTAEATEPAPAWTAELDHVQLQFVASTGAFEQIRAQPLVHGHPLEIFGRYPATAKRELVREHIREALAAIEVLDENQCAELRLELERGAAARDLLGPSWSLRGDVYRNFDFGVRARIPSRTMQVVAGNAAERAGDGVVLLFADRGRQRRGMLLAYELDETSAVDPQTWHEHAFEYAARLGIDKHGPVERQQYGDAVALVQVLENTGERRRVQLASVVHERHGLAMIVEAVVGAESAEDLVATPMFEIDEGLERARTVAGRYFDAHAGFAIDPPLPVDARNESADSPAFFLSQTYWTHGGEEVEVLVHNWEPIAGPLGQYTRARMEVIEARFAGRSSPEWIEVSSPHAGHYLTWIDGDLRYHAAALFVRERTIYELQVRSRADRLFAQTLSSFEILDLARHR